MFSRFFKTRMEWRRTAVYGPLRVEGAALGDQEEAKRQSVLKACQVGLHASLRCEPTGGDPGAVAAFAGDERLLGYLPREVGEGVAPLLESGTAAFDAEICSLEKLQSDAGRETLDCRLMLTRHDLVPVARFALMNWLFGDRRSSEHVAVPRGVRDSG